MAIPRRPSLHVVVVDHHDSFTYNLVQALEVRGARCTVVFGDRTDLAAIDALAPDGLLLSPGPCAPDDAGIGLALVRGRSGRVPILGVCLGHQVIAQAFGARIVRARQLIHGRVARIDHGGDGLFEGLPLPLVATRYNSLSVDPQSLPDVLEATAWSEDRDLMALRHRDHPTVGVQFHPESILSVDGPRLLDNWLRTLAPTPGAGR